METVTALVAAGAAFAASYLIGRSLTASLLLVMLGGLLAGASFAVLFFVSTVTVGHMMPGLFEPWLLGVHFIALAIVGPLGGAAIAGLTHRHVERADASRLPF
ncbi:hypothetical protein LJ725_07650 [Reyranella aquatilis]|uniref:Major facilitator superfamily (MFS) profile domain-containing protein n=1 Tax=Reyranella aquatilis TaxID=2035356 RepID=A0ABS8KSV0_9HYPH|nr:hypothetical protein [Reyranella aquatilis]MCC8428832.1 hypothetical protein [Reyranella aquatilis]